MINIGLIGFGRIGRRYFKILNESKSFNLIKILRKKKYKKKNLSIKFYNKKKDFFNKSKNYINAYIIASPVNTHYEYIKTILQKKKPLIIEKPIVKDVNELNKIKKLSKNINYPVLVNHSDLYNPAFKVLEKKIKLIGNFKKIKIVFGKFQQIYKINRKSNILLPYFDWLSHPIAVAIKIAGLPRKIEILNKKTIIKKKFIFQKIHTRLFCKKKIVDIFFSNNYKIPKRKILIKGDRGSINYDAYKVKSLQLKIKNRKIESYYFKHESSLNNLLEVFSDLVVNKKKINDISLSIKVMKIIFLIQKKLNLDILKKL